jgi:TonB family protein
MLRPRQPGRPDPLTGSARLAAALLLALLIHAAGVGLIVLTSLIKLDLPDRFKPPRDTAKAVTLRGLTAEQWNKNRSAAPSPVRDERKVIAKNRDEKKPEEKKPEEMPKGQIVDVAKGNDKVDPNAKFIAETNNQVTHETRAKEQTANYRNAAPQRTAPRRVDGNGTDVADNAQKSGTLGVGDDDRPLRTAQPKMAIEVPDVHKRQEVALRAPSTEGPGLSVTNRDEREEMKGNSKRLNLQPGSVDQGEAASAGRSGAPGALNLLPSPAVVDKITGAAANDRLDADEGDGTYLNTREWKYASFFNRVKQSVGQQWVPTAALRQRDPSGAVYGGRDRYTLLTITLDQSGRLKDAFVDKSSGLDFLDLEAVKAFERAQPFPNPPPGILAADQTVRFQFGFFLEMTGRPGMRLFRSTE